MNKNILFVTWDGPQSNYLDGLFLPIFNEISKKGYKFTILQFTWGEENINQIKKKFNIDYYKININRKSVFIGSIIALIYGIYGIRKLIKNLGINIILARSTLPVFASIIAIKRHKQIKLIFDADGLPYDERIDFGNWDNSDLKYRILKDIESYAINKADSIMTRSNKAIDILIARAGPRNEKEKFHVVVNARDEKVFKPYSDNKRKEIRNELGFEKDDPLIVFVGSDITGKYNAKVMFKFFEILRKKNKDTKFLIITGSKEKTDKVVNDYIESKDGCVIIKLSNEKVPIYLNACDLGLAIIQPSFSMQAASAIKIGEYLLCGVPVLSTKGIGDADNIINEECGYILNSFETCELEKACNWFFENIIENQKILKANCRKIGIQKYSINHSVSSYLDAIEYCK